MSVKKLFVFTENYEQGGGNRYLVDLVNSVSFKFEEILVFSNKKGIFHTDLSRFNREVNLATLFFITSSLILNKFKHLNSRLLNFYKILFNFLDPILLALNVIFFLLPLIRSKPNKVLVCNGGYPASRACLAMVISSKILCIPVVMSIVSAPLQRRAFAFYYEKIIDLLIWNCVSKVIVNANFIADQLVKLRGLAEVKISVVYNGLENIKPPIFLKKNQKKLVIGCIARVDKEKGVFYLLHAFNVLVSRNPFLKLVIIGSGSAFNQLSTKVDSLGLTDKVSLPGHYSGDITLPLSNFDIYVFPSLWEGFPYSILEAMRSGCAIVSTNVGGIPEAITNGVDGILIEPASSADLVLGLTRLIEDCELRYKLSSNARKKFQENFTLNQMASAVRKIL
ncbi:glycosyltransferase family 4 protein [Polynucleobacter sp. AM-26B4]|uniref:glycosyltransferase family 4 protein n=1 Tax=Polynucleobacter sp. AM-26B4 TaxID=2689103 RepID=UPI001C0E2AA3|nr:glycosyltransferase family 4 protein [Polynucleobacter sp. AM-26B4]MBU3585133.1 glycosyltransferase family 4 protein [Polynucleobacter sp. AM-26B4]